MATKAKAKAPERPLVMSPTAALVPYERNARTHSPEQVEQIAASIQEFGFTNPILIDEQSRIIAGHGRLLAAKFLGLDAVPSIVLPGLSDAQRRALVLADNQLAMNAGWDMDLLAQELEALQAEGFDTGIIGFEDDWLESLLHPDAEQASGPRTLGAMAAEFLVPPFSVLNAREGIWQERKRAWLALGIQSELGRGENLIGRSLFERISFIAGNHYQQTRDFVDEHRAQGKSDDEILEAAEAKWGRAKGHAKAASFHNSGYLDEVSQAMAERGGDSGTSIFDPVLCELAYRWFSPSGGLVLDPFAGGSVRGIVAGVLGRPYVGIDLRAEQCEANRQQAAAILAEKDDASPEWLEGDAADVLDRLAPDTADLIFSCPPYGDLERYSDDARDLSTMDDKAFRKAYRTIIHKACERLKPDRFACFIVGDYRDAKGFYADFISETIGAFKAGGAKLYNHAILITAVGSLPIRAGRTFRATRKLGTTHQHVLIFCKGDPRKATEACGPVDVDAALANAQADGELEGFDSGPLAPAQA